jgi:hypothetical protein
LDPIDLRFSHGNPTIDRALRGIVGIFEETFPGRIRSYFLVGSQADSSAVSLSDLDIRVVFKGIFSSQLELKRFLQVREYLRLINSVDIDCPPLDEQRLLHDETWLHETINIKYASQYLFGDDIRGELPPPTLEAYLRNTGRALCIFVPRLHRQEQIHIPLQYPDPQDEFYGYDDLDSHQGLPSLKMLVHVGGFLASWKVGHQAGQMVFKKSTWLSQYQTLIHDSWTPLLEELWERCKFAWSYRLPDIPRDRAWLRRRCEEFLDFENDTLTNYPIPVDFPHPG